MALIKVLISAVLIAVASEIARRSTIFAAMIISLPLVSMISIAWLYIDTKNLERVQAYSWEILLFVPSSLAFFISLPLIVQKLQNFWLSFFLSCVVTVVTYFSFFSGWRLLTGKM